MLEASALKFTIQSSGRTQELCVDSVSVRVGSGSHCEIRLEPEDASVEQLWVNARAGGVFAEARCLDPPILLNGSAFVQGRLLPDSVLKLGRVEISVDVVERHSLKGNRSGTTNASRRALYALAGVGIPLSILLLGLRTGTTRQDFDIPTQTLWSENESARCPDPDRSSAAARANDLSSQAESGRERTAFSPEDGVKAVELYAQAAACYALAGAGARADQASLEAKTLRHELSARFHVHQVRLERALSNQHYDRAKLEVRALLSFVRRRRDAYSDWLAALDRQIITKSSEQSQ